jgi:hypothetical protein
VPDRRLGLVDLFNCVTRRVTGLNLFALAVLRAIRLPNLALVFLITNRFFISNGFEQVAGDATNLFLRQPDVHRNLATTLLPRRAHTRRASSIGSSPNKSTRFIVIFILKKTF